MRIEYARYFSGNIGTDVFGDIVSGKVSVGDKLRIVSKEEKEVIVKKIEIGLSKNKKTVKSASAGTKKVNLTLNNTKALSVKEFEEINESKYQGNIFFKNDEGVVHNKKF